ncbi:hypothetical protein IL45_05230 [Nonlabens ulvanivorans]|uniref:Uncharacterized protein n=2 Tax=Nonlabens ulvanivorans TaxID=906888 RepID=A0A084JXC5_NONUL|nr:hypothetical protein IL45_05230 [Nonlabens ulvanivorans]
MWQRLKIENMKNIVSNFKTIGLSFLAIMILSCDGDEVCGYTGDNDPDCPNLEANIGDDCDSNGDTILDGTVNEFCECIGEMMPPVACGDFMQNVDFEVVTGDVNASIDQDINLATSWGPLWGSGSGSASLADLWNSSSTLPGGFVQPTPSSGNYAGMWIENSNAASPSFREGMFNQLSTSILPSTGIYVMSFNHAVMGITVNNDVKIGVYGVNFSGTLPPNPTSMQTPSNLDLYGPGNSVLLGEILVPAGSSNTYTTASLSFDTNSLTMPAAGFTHIMITHSHIVLPDFGRMFIAFDDYCLISE